MSLFSELKRRNVFRVALLYAVGSWLILQVTDVGISLLGLPDWTGRFVFFILLLGLPLVLVFSWAYEITPDGLRRERDVPRDSSITHETAHKLNMAVVALLVLAIAGMVADRLIPEDGGRIVETVATDGTVAAPVMESIAVLPFVNMSSDQDNQYFSDGLSEELLNLLAKIPDLQVAARTSAFSFRNADADITEIANKLNVAHVLEGSVRKSGNDIRVTAQLIKAADGYHVWSETWDRTLDDVFAIQDEIAAAVVDALKVSLLGEVPHARVTAPRVFELYLQAKAAANRFTADGLEEATKLLTEALAIDPDYAEGWRQLGTVQINQVGQGFVPAERGYPAAKAASERALAIDPESAEALTNLGWIAMYSDWDFAQAANLISRARRLRPGNASVLNTYAVMNGAFGRRSEMISYYEEALVNDPVSMSILGNLAGAYLTVDVGRTAEMIERMRGVEPDSLNVPLFAAWMHLFGGNSEVALQGFESVGGTFATWGRSMALWDLGRDEESDAALKELAGLEGTKTLIAVSYAYRDDHDSAFEWLEKAYQDRDYSLIEVRMFPMENLFGDPRWERFLSKLGISDADANRVF